MTEPAQHTRSPSPWQALIEGRRRHGLRRYLRRALRRQTNRLFHRADRRALAAAFRRVGLEPGTTVCVHSALSRLGYVVGGPATVIQALIEVVGSSGCIMMPAFSMRGSMLEYLDGGDLLDVRSTPSAVGLSPRSSAAGLGSNEASTQPTQWLRGGGEPRHC